MTVSNEMAAPAAVQAAINGYAAKLGDYFTQHNITYSVSCNVAADISVDSRVWTAGYQPDQTMFIGSAVKTFMLAEYLRSDLSETAVMKIDDSVRSMSSTVFGDETYGGESRPDVKLEGETLARSVLEAMISHSDNTATDAVLAAVGADNVRDMIGDLGLSSVKIPESTRQLFAYLASGQDVPVSWETVQQYVNHAPNPQQAINNVESMLASASDMVSWYETALLDPSFFTPADLAQFKRISSMADALHQIVPDNLASYGKGGSITWNGFSCISVSGQMLVPTTDPGRPWVPVTFSFAANWGKDDGATFGAVASIFAPAIKAVLTASMDSFFWTATDWSLTAAPDTFTGTASQDDFSGPAGGLDTLSGVGGDDLFTIQAGQVGLISGGSGYDTVHALGSQLDSALTFDTVEALRAAQSSLHGTVAQFANFGRIFAPAGSDHFHVVLQGAGGTLGFSNRFVSPILLDVDASAATSGVTLTGTAHADGLTGSSFADFLSGGSGDDSISGRGGGDTIVFGSGRSVLHDTLADMNGDTIVGLGTKNALAVGGSVIGRDRLAIVDDDDGKTLKLGGTSIKLDGDFANGEFMAVARGGSIDATTVSYVKHLPTLAEGVRVDPASINGVANEPFLAGDGSVKFTLQFESAVSAHSNALGTYRIAADGTIGDVHIAYGNTLNVTAGARTVDLGAPADGARIGFFLIQDGFDLYGTLPNDLSFRAPGGGIADLDAGQVPILTSASRGALTAAPIFHSSAAFNPGGGVQVLSGAAPGGRDLRIGFEDLQNPVGDNDFQDVVVTVHTNADGLFIL
ncbi:MAG: serine hydrolase [Reyranella sp.]|nr:serine hydrolase [Reyranella sp.]